MSVVIVIYLTQVFWATFLTDFINTRDSELRTDAASTLSCIGYLKRAKIFHLEI